MLALFPCGIVGYWCSPVSKVVHLKKGRRKFFYPPTSNKIHPNPSTLEFVRNFWWVSSRLSICIQLLSSTSGKSLWTIFVANLCEELNDAWLNSSLHHAKGSTNNSVHWILKGPFVLANFVTYFVIIFALFVIIVRQRNSELFGTHLRIGLPNTTIIQI